MSEFVSDVKYAARTLRKSPGFTAVAVLTLALGIGANSAIFSVVNGVVLKPLPYARPDRLVAIYSQGADRGLDEYWISAPEYMELRERARSYDAIGAYRTGMISLGDGESPMRVTSAFATMDLFRALGVNPLLGRTFTEEEDIANGRAAVVLSHGLWRRGFDGDPGVIGRPVEVDGAPSTVVGVMPPGYDVAEAGVEAWVPAQLDPANLGHPGNHYLNLIARLRSGVRAEQAQRELAGLVQRWADETSDRRHVLRPDVHELFLRPLHEDLIGGIRPALLMLLGAVGFVLLIACANVGNLLLARAEGRGREIAVRAALGAGRVRLLRQFVTESTLLSLLGGGLGLALGWAAVRALLATSPESIPRADEVTLDGSVLAFTLLVSLFTGLLFGLAPAFHLRARTMNSALREGGLRTTAGAGRQRLRRSLVVSEVALAVVLVVGSGLMLRSFAALQEVDPGFDARNLLTFEMFLPAATYPDWPARETFIERSLQRLGALPGVRAATATMTRTGSGLPTRRAVDAIDFEFEGYTPTEDGPPNSTDYYQFVTTNYFEAMRIPLLAGRTFGPQDGREAGPVVMVNETLANLYYADSNPIGRRLRPGGDNPWFTIIGVVKDVKQGRLQERTGTEVYFHYPQVVGAAPRTMNVVLRAGTTPASLAPAVRREMAALDESLPLANMQGMDRVLHGSIAQPRFLTLLLGSFAAIALTLAAIGTYGLMSYSVAERRQEIGIRMALGADAGGVLTMVLTQGAVIAGLGLALGVAGALAASRMLASLLYGVGARDLTTFLLAPAVLAAVALVACWIPAWRATRVDPARVLRQE
ncbi:MAG: ABC transporter permease [Longimicrobiales bacterium]